MKKQKDELDGVDWDDESELWNHRTPEQIKEAEGMLNLFPRFPKKKLKNLKNKS